MASQRNTGRAVQIVRLERGRGCSLDREALEQILLDDNVKDLPVVVVSVAGIFRKGKSFLLNFFVQYMRNRGQGDWMVDNVPLQGFRWRGGSKTETSGIWIWDEVFVVTTTGGKEVAVIFMDTQGTFDTKSTVNNCTTIFALSMMTSSVQIYNISQNIGEDHLQHLQLFTQYGKLALKSQDTEKKPFQKLLFLVRDWQYGYESAYGFDGGNDILEQLLEVSEELDPELQRIRSDIQSCFSEISCFLMPHPGTKVASEPNFAGCLSDIDDRFKEQLRVLVSTVLQPNNLVVKKISNADLTCRQMLDYFGKFAEIFNGDNLPDPKSIFETSVEAQNSAVVDTAMEDYRNGMKQVLRGDVPFLDPQSLQGHHYRRRELALQLFARAPKLGGVARSKPYKDRLEKLIDQEFESISSRNEGERIKAEVEKIMEEARKEAKRIIDEAEAECKNTRIAEDFVEFLLNAASLLDGAFEKTSDVTEVVTKIAAFLRLATIVYKNREVLKLIAKMIKKKGIDINKKIMEWIELLESWILKKGTTGAAANCFPFVIDIAKDLHKVLAEIHGILDEDEGGAKKG